VLDMIDISTSPATVRVVRGPNDRPEGVCLDQVGFGELTLASARPAGGRVRVALGAFDFPFGAALSAGRCAGPLPADLAAALPRASVSTRELRGDRLTLDFTGRRPFAAGAFAGEVTSTLVVRGKVTRGPDRVTRRRLPVPVRGRPRGRVALLRLGYRATPGAEGLTSTFRAADTARCAILDACGLAGTLTLTVPRPLDLALSAVVPLARGRRPTVERALAAVHAGRGSVFVEPTENGVRGRSVVDVARDGAPACHDERPLTLPELSGATHGGQLVLGLGGTGFSASEDPLRTRCPGPGWSSERDGSLARGAVPLAQLGAQQLTLRLTARGIRDPDFALAPAGAVTLELQRTRASVRKGLG
jgi:hypothetical protein